MNRLIIFLLLLPPVAFGQATSGLPSPSTAAISGQANGVIPLGTSANKISAQSHCDDGVTASGTVTCTEPTTTPVQDKGGQVFNVKAFGAKGNGGIFFDGAIAATKVFGAATGNSANPSAPSITTLTANDYVLSIYLLNSTWSVTPPNGANLTNLVFGGGGSYYGSYINGQTVASPGSVAANTGTGTSSAYWATLSLPFAPKAGQTISPVGTGTTASMSSPAGSVTLTINKVSAQSTGDHLVGCVNFYTQTSRMMTAPAGWTFLALETTAHSDNLACYTKIVTASEPSSYTWTIPASAYASGSIVDLGPNVAGVDGFSTTLTSASAGFTGSAVGNPICIAGINAYNSSTGTMPITMTDVCGTITGFNSPTSVSTTIQADQPLTNIQFATGTPDDAAFSSAITACTAVGGCTIQLPANRFVLLNPLSLTTNINIVGAGACMPNTANNFLNSNTPSNKNCGTQLMWLTQSLTGPALSVTGSIGVSNDYTMTYLANFSLAGATGYGGDGGGSYGLAIYNWYNAFVDHVSVMNFVNSGVYVDALANSNNDYTAAVRINAFSTFNGNCGVQLGGNGAAWTETTEVDSSSMEANFGPGLCINGVTQAMVAQNNTIQWNNRNGVSTNEVGVSGSGTCGAGCMISGNYIEVDTNMFSASLAPIAVVGGLAGARLDNNFIYPASASAIVSYSAAGTAIPSCSTSSVYLNNATAKVSDATVCTNGTTYTPSGSTRCIVRCTGSNAWTETGAGW